MEDWGIPDWTNALAYGSTDCWDRNRWRWEFLRRREDLREEFKRKADAVYLDKLALFERIPDAFSKDGPTRPCEAGFFVSTRAISGELQKLPNPAISEQPPEVLNWIDGPDTWVQHFSETPPVGMLRFDFDLSKPIEPQLRNAREVLREFQADEMGRLVQRRERPEKWLSYLRVLDGREAGASWTRLAGILPMTAGTAQTARDTWMQARALCFNF